MPTLANCLGKSVLPAPYKKRLLEAQKKHSLSMGMVRGASSAIDEIESEVTVELDQMLGQLGVGQTDTGEEVRASPPAPVQTAPAPAPVAPTPAPVLPTPAVSTPPVQAEDPNEEVRFSMARGRYSSLADYQTDKDRPGADVTTLSDASRQQGWLMPQSSKAMIKLWGDKRNPAVTLEQRVAYRYLRPIRDQGELTRDLPRITPATDTLPDESRNHGAMVILNQNQQNRTFLRHLKSIVDATQKRFEDANKMETDIIIERANVEIFGNEASQMLKNYSGILFSEAAAAKASGDMNTAAHALEASGQINAYRRTNVIPLASALKNAAMQIPETELKTPESAAAWIRSRQLDKTQPPLMTDEVFKIITTPIGKRRIAPLESYPSLNTKLAKIKKIVANGKSEAANVTKLKSLLNPKTGRFSLVQFASQYAKAKHEQADAFETLSIMSGQYTKAKRMYEGAKLAYDTMLQILEHPEYLSVLTDAVNRLNARTWGTMGEDTDAAGKEFHGQQWILNPLTNQKVSVDLTTDRAVAKDNLTKINDVREDIRLWMLTPAAEKDPILKRTYAFNLEMIEQWMIAVGDPTFVGTTVIPGANVPSFSASFQNPFRLIPGARKVFATLRNLAHKTGGVGMARINRLVASMDAYASFIQAHDDKEMAIDEAIEKALSKRGMKTTGENQYIYRALILEPILSQNQNPTSNPYKVGQRVYGNYRVIQEDLDAAKVQTTWIDGLYKFLQAQGYKPQGLEPNDAEAVVRSLLQDPLLNEDPDVQLAQHEITEKDPRKRLEGRRGVAFGFKAPRVKDKQGKTWSERWFKASQRDEAANQARPEADKANPEIIQARLALFDDPDFFRVAVLGMMLETNDEFVTTYKKENKDTRNQIVDEFRRGSSDTDSFDDITELFGEIEADRKALLGANAADETEKFRRRVVEHIGEWMARYDKKPDANTDVLGQAGRRRDIIVVGHNPFSKERGDMVAPSTFYKYSQADQRSRLQLHEQVMIQFRGGLIEALESFEAALDRDYQRAYDDLLKSTTPDPSRIKWLTKGKSIKWRRRAAVTKGQANGTIGDIQDAKRMTQFLVSEFKRLNTERAEQTMDDYGLRFARKLIMTPIIGVLASVSPAINNIMQGTHAAMVLEHSLGNGGKLAPLPEMVRFVMTMLSSISHELKIPLLGDLVRMWEYELTDPETSSALSQGLIRPWDTMRKAAIARKYSYTGGVSSAEPEEDNLMGKIVNIPGIHQLVGLTNLAWQASIRFLPGEIENGLNAALLIHTRKQINRFNTRFLNYVRSEAASGPGWEARLISHPDTTNRALRSTGPSDTAAKTLRHVMQEAGSLEQLLIRFHERTKHLTLEEAARESFLTTDEVVQAALVVARDFNKRGPSGDLTWFMGKGFLGFFKSLGGTFMRAPAQASEATGIYLGTVPGETEPIMNRAFRAVKLGIGLLLMAMSGLEFGKFVIQALYKTGRTVRRPGDIETPGQMLSYVAAMMSPWGSTLPAIIQQSTGDVSTKPILDASEMNIAASLVRDANRALIEMLQTGNVTQPAGDLIERYFPMTRIISSRTFRSGEPEITAASRELRFAAPPGVEIQRLGGGGGGVNKTPLSPVIRKLAQAVGANDTSAIEELTEKAVQMQMDNGYSRQDAVRSVQRSLAYRSPVRRAFPRRLSEGEMRRTYEGLSPASLDRVKGLQDRFDALTRRPTTTKQSTGTSKRKKRSALRSKRRRSSLRAASFSYV